MQKQPIEEYLTGQLTHCKARYQRVQNAIDALSEPEDKDIINALLVARAYMSGAIEALENTRITYR